MDLLFSNNFFPFQFSSAVDVKSLREIADEHSSLLVDSGFSKPFALLSFDDKTTKAEIDQFCID